MKHKHADLIHAWAEGAEIEKFKLPECNWQNVSNPVWEKTTDYRIKPTTKPDVVKFVRASIYSAGMCDMAHGCEQDNIKLTFDGETEQLKSAEVLK